MTLGFILLGLGLLLGFGSFAFIASNMANHAKNFFADGPMNGSDSFDGMFSRHISGMIGMAVGGLLMMAGLLAAGYSFLH